MARQSHPAHLPILEALLYRWAGAWHREQLQQRVPCVEVFVLIRIDMETLLMSRTSFDGTGIPIHHLLFSVGVALRGFPPPCRQVFTPE